CPPPSPVPAYRHPASPDGRPRERRDDRVGDTLLDIDEREAVVDLDGADDAARHACLVRDRADEVARSKPAPTPATDPQPDPRSVGGTTWRPSRPRTTRRSRS